MDETQQRSRRITKGRIRKAFLYGLLLNHQEGLTSNEILNYSLKTPKSMQKQLFGNSKEVGSAMGAFKDNHNIRMFVKDEYTKKWTIK